MNGKKLYLQGRYNEALKHLREDDPFEKRLIESIRFSGDFRGDPQLYLLYRRFIINQDKEVLRFLKGTSNRVVKKLVNIIECLTRNELNLDNLDHLVKDLSNIEKAIVWYFIGSLYRMKGDYKRAEYCAKKCLGLGDAYWRANGLYLLGFIYRNTGRYDEALEKTKKALKIFKKLGDKYGIGHCKYRISEIYLLKGNPGRCLDYASKSLKIYESLKYPVGIACAKHIMGMAYFLKRDYDKALSYVDEAINAERHMDEKVNAVHDLRWKALILSRMGYYEEALSQLEEAERIISRDAKHYFEVVKVIKAETLLEMGKVSEARDILERSLRMAKELKDFDDIIKNLRLIVESGAVEYLEELRSYYKELRRILSIPTAKDVAIWYDFRGVVDVLLDKDILKAYECYLEFNNPTAVALLNAKVLRNVVGEEVFEKIREKEKRIQSLLRNIESEEFEKISNEHEELIEEAFRAIGIETFLKAEGDEEVVCFHFGERTGYFYRREFKDIEFKGLRGFVEDLLRNESVKSDCVKSALLKLYGKRGIKGKRVEVKGDWVFIVYDGGRYWWANLNRRDDLLRLLSDILLACLTHSSHTVALDKDKNNKKNKDENKSKNKYEKLSKFYNQISEEILRRLGEEVFGGLFAYDEVIIAPAYPLMNFPYHLLMNGKKTLIEEVRVKYVPHSGVAKWLRDRGKEDLRKALEKVTIVYYRESYKDKEDPSSIEKEAKEIGKLLPEANLIDATDIEKEELLSMIKEDSEVLHFACHAEAMPKAQYSYFRFPNFKLYLPDFLSLKLKNLKMACLSACETGRFEEAIDTLGFPLAFFAKGAKCVLATLWRVYGESTKEFFVKFYRQILSGSDVYEAYHSALMKLKKRWGLMYFWGPFVYYGI